MNRVNINIPSLCIVLGIFFCSYTVVQGQVQQDNIDSTIKTVINPQKDLRLWYGVENFEINDLVVLPKYTIIYNQEFSLLKLIKNKNRVVVDEYKLNSLKGLKITPTKTVEGKTIKSALNIFSTWFSIENDTTINIGTLSFDNNQNGFAKIAIIDDKLSVNTQEYKLDDDELDIISMKKSFNMMFLTNMYSFASNQVYIRPETFKSLDGKKQVITTNSVFSKTKSNKLTKIYEVPSKDDKNVNLNSIQLLQSGDNIYLIDNYSDSLISFDNNFKEKYRLTFRGFPKNDLIKRSFGRSFFVDKIDNSLYYTSVYTKEKENIQMVYKVVLDEKKIDFIKLRETNLRGYIYKQINDKTFFVIDKRTNFIYTFNLE
jgi:hypothetical protein